LTDKEYKQKIRKIKPTVFTNLYKRVWCLVYSDDILLLGYLSKSLRDVFLSEVIMLYKSYGFIINKEKLVINNNPKLPIKYLGFEIFESSKYKYTSTQRQKSYIIIRADKEKIIESLIEKRLLMKRKDASPYATRDTNKHEKNVLKKKFTKITNWSISSTYKPLHNGVMVPQAVEKIIMYYNYKMQGIYNYFKCTDQFFRLSQIFSFLRFSCYKTLTAKFKIGTIRKLFIKYGKNLEKLTTIPLLHLNTKKIPLVKCLKTNNYKVGYLNEVLNSFIVSDTAMILKECSICKSEKNLESHHIKSVKKLRDGYKMKRNHYKFLNYKYIQEKHNIFLDLLHIAVNRKQVTLCRECHTGIHNGTIKKNYLLDLTNLLKKKQE
jgi:hypothetical protein